MKSADGLARLDGDCALSRVEGGVEGASGVVEVVDLQGVVGGAGGDVDHSHEGYRGGTLAVGILDVVANDLLGCYCCKLVAVCGFGMIHCFGRRC